MYWIHAYSVKSIQVPTLASSFMYQHLKIFNFDIIELIGPLPVAAVCYSYILIVVAHLTKGIEAASSSSDSAKTAWHTSCAPFSCALAVLGSSYPIMDLILLPNCHGAFPPFGTYPFFAVPYHPATKKCCWTRKWNTSIYLRKKALSNYHWPYLNPALLAYQLSHHCINVIHL